MDKRVWGLSLGSDNPCGRLMKGGERVRRVVAGLVAAASLCILATPTAADHVTIEEQI